LSSTDDLHTALARYEQFMRPHLAAAQHVRPAVLRRANPRTPAGIRALHTGARAIASPAVRAYERDRQSIRQHRRRRYQAARLLT
jgi:2-keto-3-deoxy-L-rhamnonate aldolase RhmA